MPFIGMVDRRAGRIDGERGRTIRERGIVIASGFMAGGALGGMLGAALRLIPGFSEERFPILGFTMKTPFYDNDPVSQTVSIVLFLAVCGYLWWDTMRAKSTE